MKKLLGELDLKKDKAKQTAIPMNGYNSIEVSTDDKPIDRTDYARIIRKLMHLMVYSRPDVAFALRKLAQFMSNPTERNGHGVKALLRYIRSTADLEIIYGSGPAKLTGYSDADFAADKTDRKSTLGQVFMFASGPISWASKKQRSVATSTTDAFDLSKIIKLVED